MMCRYPICPTLKLKVPFYSMSPAVRTSTPLATLLPSLLPVSESSAAKETLPSTTLPSTTFTLHSSTGSCSCHSISFLAMISRSPPDRLGKALSQLESATHHPPPSQSLTPSDPFLLPAVLPPQIPYPGRSYPVSRPFELPFAPSAEIVLSTDYLFRLVKLMAEHNKRVVPEVCYKACKIAWIDDSRMMRVVGCERGSVGVGPVGRVGSQLSGVRPDVKDVERREGAGVAKNDSEVEQKGPTQMEKGRKGNVEKAPQRKETPQRTFESSSKGAANNDSDSSSDSDADGPHDNEFKGTNSSSSTFTTPSTSTTATFTGTKTPVDSASDNDNENDDENGAASYSDTEIGTSRIRAADLRGKNKCFGDGTSARGKGWSRRWVDVSFGWAWTAEDEEDEEDWAA